MKNSHNTKEYGVLTKDKLLLTIQVPRKYILENWRFWHRCCWTFKSSGTLHRVNW